MSGLRFAKLSGAGNDFIVLDGRPDTLPAITPSLIKKLCQRGMSVGADGLVVLQPSDTLQFVMQFFNADGSEAAMCGNGGRCIARFAVLVGAAKEGETIRFQAPSGQYTALVQGARVKLSLIPPQRFEQAIAVPLQQGERQVDFTNTGVPHAVLFTDSIETEDIKNLGREIRFHPRFAPQGTNVNFCTVLDRHQMRVRTYERGVEDETLACGTGAAAAALLAARRGWVDSPVRVITQSRLELELEFTQTKDGFQEIFQTGEARLVYWGELTQEAIDYPDH